MGNRICVGGYEEAVWILTDAESGVLDLVVVKVSIKSYDNGANILVVLHELTRS